MSIIAEYEAACSPEAYRAREARAAASTQLSGGQPAMVSATTIRQGMTPAELTELINELASRAGMSGVDMQQAVVECAADPDDLVSLTRTGAEIGESIGMTELEPFTLTAAEESPGYPALASSVSAEERRALADKGHALPDGSYPIPDVAHLHAAARLAASKHDDYQAAIRQLRAHPDWPNDRIAEAAGIHPFDIGIVILARHDAEQARGTSRDLTTTRSTNG